jgi:sugar lactone lactonase YvrE
MKFYAITLTILLFFVGCQKSDQVKHQKYELTEVAVSSDQWTGLSLSQDGRLFVNYPRWSKNLDHSVAEIKNNKSVLFPDEKWNEWNPSLNPKEHFICVQSVFIDDNNKLWVLDPANPMFQGVVKNGAKLLRFNIENKSLEQRIVFDSTTVKSNSYLNDVRIDENRNFAYITDSNDGAIIVVNLETGNARRLLDNHISTAPELPLVINGEPWTNASGNIQLIASDGIALDREDKYLYYHALNGLSLYRIHTKFLRNESYSNNEIKENVEFVARTTSSDGLIAGPDNEIYHSDVENNAISVYKPNGQTQTLVQNKQIKWPDTFSFGPDGALYFTTSQIHIPNPSEPYKIFKINIK